MNFDSNTTIRLGNNEVVPARGIRFRSGKVIIQGNSAATLSWIEN